MSKTSAIFLCLYFTCKVSRLNRCPLHTSHSTNTGGKKCISIKLAPAPWHASQRPPGRLKENLPKAYPLSLDSGRLAKKSRMGVKIPVYVAGFERGVRPIGD